jgi:hypothetical protein
MVAFAYISAAAQDTISLKNNYQSVIADELKNIYLWNDENLEKKDFVNHKEFIYNNISLGAIYLADVKNPMKILVYHADFNTIVTLDNTLSQNGSEINLADYNLENTSLICRSYNNGIWCYDAVLFKLRRFDNLMNPTNEIENLQNIVTNTDSVFYLSEVNDYLYVQTPKEVFVFDKYGSYIKSLPIVSDFKITVFEKGIFFLKNNSLNFYSFKNIDIVTVPVIINDKPLDYTIADKTVYLLYNKKLVKLKL